MTVPRFDPRTDAGPAVRAGWLHPGERLLWTRYSHTITVEVPGRARSGKVLKQSPWRTVGRRALAVADGAVTVLDFFASDTPGDPARPEVRVFGNRVDCQAAVSTETHTDRSFWVLTDRRFAYLRADPDGLATVWELPYGGFGYSEFTKKRLTYERFTFADGSLIDFRRPRRLPHRATLARNRQRHPRRGGVGRDRFVVLPSTRIPCVTPTFRPVPRRRGGAP